MSDAEAGKEKQVKFLSLFRNSDGLQNDQIIIKRSSFFTRMTTVVVLDRKRLMNVMR